MAVAPTLRTPRLALEAFSGRHLSSAYVGWLNDPRTVRFSEQRFRAHTLESCRSYVESFADSPHYLWAITRGDGGEHVGNITAHCEPRHGTADVGILLGHASHGQGLGTEAWVAVCDYLLRTCGLRKVTAGTLATNAGMLGILRKAGMVIEYERPRQCIWEGREVAIVGAAVFREDWLARHPGEPFTQAQ